MTSGTTSTGITRIQDIPGWFRWVDQQLFAHFLSVDDVPSGNLVELGVYLGKSAALIGKYRRPGETFTVLDLFGAHASDASNQAENDGSYRSLSREAFERNYLAIHDELPVVIQGPSSEILEHVKPESARFIHVDASHLYEHVSSDIDAARTLLMPHGVAVFDDFRSEHTPGVSAAVWEAVFTKELRPICVTTKKFYGTFGDPRVHRERLEAWLRRFQRCKWETLTIAGESVVRILPPRPARGTSTNTEIATMSTTLDGLSRDLARLVREVADGTDRVNARMAKTEREMAQLRRARGSTLERALRRTVRRLRAHRARR